MPSKEPRLTEAEAKTIKQRVEYAIRYADKEYGRLCKRASALYDGEHWPDSRQASKRTTRIVVNYIRPTVDTKVANVAFAYPEFMLKPLTQEAHAHAEIAEQVLRYDWRIAKVQQEARRALRDREIYGLGIVYDGWLFETEPTESDAGIREEGGRPSVAVEADDTTPDAFTDDTGISSAEKVRTDRPFARRLDPRSFFVDPESDAVLANARFCGFTSLEPLDQVKRDGRFKNTRQLKGDAGSMKPYLNTETKARSDEDFPTDLKRVRLHHYYEMARKLHIVLAEEHDKPLLVERWRWDGDWYPFATIRVPDEEGKFFPMPPPLWIEHQQREINEARTQHSEMRRKAAPAYQTEGNLDEEQKIALSGDQAGRVVQNLGKAITPIPHAPIPQEILLAGQQALGDLQFIAGLNDYETATPPSKRLTQSEVAAVREAGGSRAAADRQAFEQFCAEIAEHMLAWEQQYSVRSRTLPIFDRDENVTGFQDYTSEQIAGQYLVEVYVGSTTAPDRKGTMEQIGFFMQGLPGFVQLIGPAMQMGIDLKPLLAQFLKALPEVRDVAGIMSPAGSSAGQPSPIPMGGEPPEAAQGANTPPPAPEGAPNPMAQLAQMMGGGGP